MDHWTQTQNWEYTGIVALILFVVWASMRLLRGKYNKCVVCGVMYLRSYDENVCSEHCGQERLAKLLTVMVGPGCPGRGSAFGQMLACDNPQIHHEGPCSGKLTMRVAWMRGPNPAATTEVQGVLFGDIGPLSPAPATVFHDIRPACGNGTEG